MKRLTFIMLCVVLTSSMTLAVTVQSGLILQLDGSDVTTTTVGSEELVTSWNDQAGTATDFVQTLQSEMPKLVTGGLNGYDTIKFDGVVGSDDVLKLDDEFAAELNPGTGGMTIFMVMKLNALNKGAYIFRKGNYSSSSDQGWSVWITSNDRLVTRLNAEDINDDAHKAGQTHTMTDCIGDFVVYSMLIDGTNLNTSINGESNYTNTWNGGTYTGSINPIDSAFLGVNTNGEMAEVLVYDRALSSTEQEQVGYSLGDKYDITTTYIPEPATVILLSLGAVATLRRKNRA